MIKLGPRFHNASSSTTKPKNQQQQQKTARQTPTLSRASADQSAESAAPGGRKSERINEEKMETRRNERKMGGWDN